MSRNERVTKETTTFFSLFKLVTFKPLLFNLSFVLAIVAAGLILYFFRDVSNYSAIVDYISNTIASISGSILGIVIAGLAILISLTQGKILGLFLQKNILQKFLFPFWFVAISWGISLIICISFKLFQYMPYKILYYLFSIETFVFVYSLFTTISLMGHAIRLGIHLASLEEK